MGKLRATALVLLLVVAASGCSSDEKDKADASASTTATTVPAAPTGPQSYTVVVDGPSTLGAENLVYATFFPKRLTVRPGDTVVFDNRSSNDVHTVTLGVKGDRSDAPVNVVAGTGNPVVFGPCSSPAPAGKKITCAPKGAGAPDYSGSGYWNSGLLLPTALPPEAGAKTATLKLGAGTPTGSYTITCLLHPYMQAELAVVGADGDRLSPNQVVAAADKELGEAKAAAAPIPVPTDGPTPNGVSVSAGWSDRMASVNRFSPETVSIKAGQTVTWKNRSEWMPHTVSFEPPYKSPVERNAFLPLGTKTGGRFAGGVAHSGAIGPPAEAPTDTYSLVFTKPGRYPYLCILHAGMAGTVEVS